MHRWLAGRRPSRPGFPGPWLPGVASALLIAACATWQWQPLGPRRTAPIEGATPVGAEECGTCHEVVQGRPRIADYHAGCESCHGGGSLHADSEEPDEIRYPSNGDCLACHAPGRDTHLDWGTGEHSRAGLFCSDCHNPHAISRYHLRTDEEDLPPAAWPEIDAVSAMCVHCHENVGAKLTYPSHHPVREGAMSCLSCHNPHEDQRVLPGENTLRCAGCHQDYIGPWIFEHPPVVEDCGYCHNPHGAVGANLLETIQPAICISCHPVNDLWHHADTGTGILDAEVIRQDEPSEPTQQVIRQSAKLFLDRCTDCHGAVHGSYTDEHLRH